MWLHQVIASAAYVGCFFGHVLLNSSENSSKNVRQKIQEASLAFPKVRTHTVNISAYFGEDMRYLISVGKDALQMGQNGVPLLSEWGRRLKGSVRTKSGCSWTMRDLPV